MLPQYCNLQLGYGENVNSYKAVLQYALLRHTLLLNVLNNSCLFSVLRCGALAQAAWKSISVSASHLSRARNPLFSLFELSIPSKTLLSWIVSPKRSTFTPDAHFRFKIFQGCDGKHLLSYLVKSTMLNSIYMPAKDKIYGRIYDITSCDGCKLIAILGQTFPHTTT